MHHTVFITGAAGYVGAMLVREFARRDDVSRIIGLDKEKKPDILEGVEKLVWIEKNTADDWEQEVAEYAPDIVVHTAWQIRELYGKRALQYTWNIEGSDKVFGFSFNRPGVKRLIYFSSVASYVADATNTLENRFTEESPFRESDNVYAEEKRIAEEHLRAQYEHAHAQNGAAVPLVRIIRPVGITGPRGRFMRVRFGLQSALSGQLKGNAIYRFVSAIVSFVPVTKKWYRQFVHEDDVVGITELLCFDGPTTPYEIYNACPPGDVVTGADMARAVGKRMVRVHPLLVRAAFFLMWHLSLGKIPTSRGGWKSYAYPVMVDGSKITKMCGYTYCMGPKDAFVKKEGKYMQFVK